MSHKTISYLLKYGCNKIESLNSFVYNVILFLKRISRQFKNKPNIGIENVVDVLYKYLLTIQTYNNMLMYKKIVFPFVSINEDKTFKGQPEFLMPDMEDDKLDQHMPEVAMKEEAKTEEQMQQELEHSISEIKEMRQFIKSENWWKETHSKMDAKWYDSAKKTQSEMDSLPKISKRLQKLREDRRIETYNAIKRSHNILKSHKLNPDEFACSVMSASNSTRSLMRDKKHFSQVDQILKKIYKNCPPA